MSFNFVPSGQLGEAAVAGRHDQPDPTAPTRPASFSVRATWTRADGERGHARGRLLISPGAIIFEPSQHGSRHDAAAEAAHTAHTVTLTAALLAPPWANTFLTLQSPHMSIRLGASMLVRRRLGAAMRDAGFEVREEHVRSAPELVPSP